MKVSIVIPMQQHSYKTAVGLIKAGFLDRYYTTVYYKKKSYVYRFLKIILPVELSKRMYGRCLAEINPYACTYFELLGLLLLFVNRVSVLKRIKPWIRKILFVNFSRLVSKDCRKRQIDFIWSFDSWSLDIYKALEKEGVKVVKILDMASTATPTIAKIIEEEYNKHESFYYTFERNRSMYSKENIIRYVEEFKYADYFLSPSEWVKKSLLLCGIPKDKILYLPHGVDINKYRPVNKIRKESDVLRFLFVGRVEGAKGIHYLFETFRQLADQEIELIVVGNTYSWREEVAHYSPNIKVIGLLRSSEMPKIYQMADVFILSSLWEGSSLSLLEAMAAGLPVIASEHSCAPDIITSGIEGFVYNPYDIEGLKSHILWFLNNKDKIKEMGIAARNKVENYTWEEYYKNVSRIVTLIKSKSRK